MMLLGASTAAGPEQETLVDADGSQRRPAVDASAYLPSLVGMRLDGRYQVGEPLGVGGMSHVFRATHLRTGGQLAIKLLAPRLASQPDMLRRCVQEARALMAIQCNNVVRAYDLGQTPEGYLYLVMEHLEGEDLGRLLAREGPIPWPRLAVMAVHICNGLSAAHRMGTIHRDIKPHNCFRVQVDGDHDFIKLIDFGIAKDTSGGAEVTQEGMLIGTPEYIAPELIARGSAPDARSDIYALGVTLYKLLTGFPPFQGKDSLHTLYHHTRTPPVPPSLIASKRGIPLGADAILLRALDKDPDRRFQSAEEMARALRRAIEVPDERPPPARKPTRTIAWPSEAALGAALRQRTAATEAAAPRPVGPEARPVGPEAQPVGPEAQPVGAPRRVRVRDVVTRGVTLVTLGMTFAVASWVAAPRTGGATAVGASRGEEDDESDEHDENGDGARSGASDAIRPIAGSREVGQLAAPGLAERASADARDGAAVDGPPVGDGSGGEVPPGSSQREDSAGAAPAPVADAPRGGPARGFDYKAAGRELADQGPFLANCLAQFGAGGDSVHFILEVRPNGLPQRIQVTARGRLLRRCIRGLFREFHFEASPHGAAFAYTYGPHGARLEPRPWPPAPAPTSPEVAG